MTMSVILTLCDQDIWPDSPVVDRSGFYHRYAARAVVINDKGEVWLLYNSREEHHKLPGGGIEEGESIPQGLKRELIEEIGCQAEIITELGETVEHRDQNNITQTSHCFIARQIGEPIAPKFDQGEKARGFYELRASDIDSALALLEKDKPNSYDGAFINRRDIELLRAAKAWLE